MIKSHIDVIKMAIVPTDDYTLIWKFSYLSR